MTIFEDYKKSCAFLENLSKLETPLEYMRKRSPEDLDKYLMRTQELLDRVGNPEKYMKYIHITGTSGKGTTVALVHAILQEAGYNVGSTSSPATTTTLERIKVNNLYINPQDFSRIVSILKPVILDMYLNSPYGKPSYFDIMLAVALIYFKEQKCDYVILEVGMGGRYDATNVIPHPLVTTITNVHHDHTHLLGNSLDAIAREKSGIIKSGSHFFTTETKPELLDIFQNECKQNDATYHHVTSGENPNFELAKNIALFLGIDDKAIERAKSDVSIPCRSEVMQKQPLVILEGAHNVSKVAYSIEKLKKLSYKKLYVIFGAGHTKDAIGMLDLIAPIADSLKLTIVEKFYGKSFSLKKMKEYLSQNFPELDVSINLESLKALDEIIKKAHPDDAILVIGSLYLAGNIRKKWYSEEYIVQKRQSF